MSNTAKNTEISYLYRDASNFKTSQSVVLKGKLSEKQVEEIEDSLFDGWQFIPRQIGLPEERNGWDISPEDDTCFFEYEGIEETDKDPTIDMSAAQMYQGFMDARENGWYDFSFDQENYGFEDQE